VIGFCRWTGQLLEKNIYWGSIGRKAFKGKNSKTIILTRPLLRPKMTKLGFSFQVDQSQRRKLDPYWRNLYIDALWTIDRAGRNGPLLEKSLPYRFAPMSF